MPFTQLASRSVLVATGLAATLALAGGAIRLLPWVLDPLVTWRVAAPFARTLGVVGGEAALAVGWPIGWALATQGLVERGEARVFRLLGERPTRTAARLARQGAVLAGVLMALSFASARESTEPGRIVTELIRDGQAACRNADAPRTFVVPFFGAAWLCAPGFSPRLAGQGPGRLTSVVYSAANARASGDLGHLEFEDAAVATPGFSLRVGHLGLDGVATWGLAASVPPLSRALALVLGVAVSGWIAVVLVLRGAPGRIAALLIGASGPLAALGALRGWSARPYLLPAVPLLASIAPVAMAAGIAWVLSRLPPLRHAASSNS